MISRLLSIGLVSLLASLASGCVVPLNERAFMSTLQRNMTNAADAYQRWHDELGEVSPAASADRVLIVGWRDIPGHGVPGKKRADVANEIAVAYCQFQAAQKQTATTQPADPTRADRPFDISDPVVYPATSEDIDPNRLDDNWTVMPMIVGFDTALPPGYTRMASVGGQWRQLVTLLAIYQILEVTPDDVLVTDLAERLRQKAAGTR